MRLHFMLAYFLVHYNWGDLHYQKHFLIVAYGWDGRYVYIKLENMVAKIETTPAYKSDIEVSRCNFLRTPDCLIVVVSNED